MESSRPPACRPGAGQRVPVLVAATASAPGDTSGATNHPRSAAGRSPAAAGGGVREDGGDRRAVSSEDVGLVDQPEPGAIRLAVGHLDGLRLADNSFADGPTTFSATLTSYRHATITGNTFAGHGRCAR
jgi:hypothetical protein